VTDQARSAELKAADCRHTCVVHELDSERVSQSILIHTERRNPRVLWPLLGVAILFLASFVDLVVGGHDVNVPGYGRAEHESDAGSRYRSR
jgi:hypothetical protein